MATHDKGERHADLTIIRRGRVVALLSGLQTDLEEVDDVKSRANQRRIDAALTELEKTSAEEDRLTAQARLIVGARHLARKPKK